MVPLKIGGTGRYQVVQDISALIRTSMDQQIYQTKHWYHTSNVVQSVWGDKGQYGRPCFSP